MTSSSRLELANLTYEDTRAVLASGAVALLPVGSTEAHGPHLPLATDVILARQGALRAARLLTQKGRGALVLPAIAYAVTDFAADFPGTLTIGLDTARALVRDVIVSAVRTGFRGVVVCNAHLEPGNLQALREAVAAAEEAGAPARFPDVTRKPHALRLGEEFKSGACHAGSYETSLVLAAEPFLVKADLAATLLPNPISLSKAIREGKTSFVQAGGLHAYFGAPSEASALEGERLYAEMADIFASAAVEFFDAAPT